MTIQLKPGLRLRSAVDGAELIVIRAPADPVDLRCGGAEVVAIGADGPAGAPLDPAWSDGTQIGKRYASDDPPLELLCTRAGAGSMSVDGVALPVKEAKPLPASD